MIFCDSHLSRYTFTLNKYNYVYTKLEYLQNKHIYI